MATKKLSCEHFFHEILRVIRTSMTGCSAGHCVLFKALKRLVSWTAIFYVHRLTAWAGISSCLFYQSLCSKNRTSFHPLLTTTGKILSISHQIWMLVHYYVLSLVFQKFSSMCTSSISAALAHWLRIRKQSTGLKTYFWAC